MSPAVRQCMLCSFLVLISEVNVEISPNGLIYCILYFPLAGFHLGPRLAEETKDTGVGKSVVDTWIKTSSEMLSELFRRLRSKVWYKKTCFVSGMCRICVSVCMRVCARVRGCECVCVRMCDVCMFVYVSACVVYVCMRCVCVRVCVHVGPLQVPALNQPRVYLRIKPRLRPRCRLRAGAPTCWSAYVLERLRAGAPTCWSAYVLERLRAGAPTCWSAYVLGRLRAGAAMCWSSYALGRVRAGAATWNPSQGPPQNPPLIPHQI